MNRFKEDKKVKTRKPSKLGKSLVGLLSGTFLGRDKVLDHVPFLLFLVGVSIAYISYGYHAETTVKDMGSLERQLKDLRAQELTLKSDLEALKQQSNVAQSISALGLKESVQQPYKVQMQDE